MGLNIFRSFSSYDEKPSFFERIINKFSPNPNPNNYKIKRAEEIGKYLVVEINYPDCTNYEGNKIIVYKTTLDKLLKQEKIDPHFSDNNKYIQPIARFVPTEDGWEMARKFIVMVL